MLLDEFDINSFAGICFSYMTCRGYTLEGLRCQNPPDGYYCYLHEPGSRYVSESLREAVFEVSNGECHYCRKKLTFANRTEGRGAWEVEHLQSHSQGGQNNLRNLRAACVPCNREKSDMSVRDFQGGERRCEGITSKGLNCPFNVAPGNRKFCRHHCT